ncbi:MAG: hypothetical protein HYY90_01975 [Candidatus Omnitrophica bacterium]|nr:hypothetical protein [Candidatus Omnitrophota bacterium]MBI3083121.1 hypothetical protein [Candidatus Omnitrophota bacterium]
MVPWPIALLSLFYGVIATVSAATLWKTFSGASDRPLLWPAMWLALSSGVMCGLPLLKPWARGLAVAASALLVAITLAVAGVVVLAGRPLMALVATVGAAVHVIAIRYLTRPAVKAWFLHRVEVRNQ